ncbi:MAG: hypothetical protein ABIO79_11095 [Ferruginibacter sp.]
MQSRFYILKILAIILWMLNSANSNCQSLKNTEWTRILVENNIEGNVIVNQQFSKKPIKYFFLEDSVLISTDESYSTKALYSIKEGTLSIGNFVKYKIDSLSDQLLIVRDVPKQGIPASSLGIYTLMNTDFIFDYLQQTHQLTVINDSLIVANAFFCPLYNGDINTLFLDQLGSFSNSTFTGSFTISKDGNIRDIQIALSKKGTKQDIVRITNIIISTKGNWITPPTSKPFDCKIDFKLLVSEHDNFWGANIYLHPQN